MLYIAFKNHRRFGMRSLGSALGKAIRRVVGGRGPVFIGRFHLNVLDSPTKMRNALAYVLQNFSKHSGLIKHVDHFSSAAYFHNWKKLLGKKMGPVLEDLNGDPVRLPDYLSPARSWLARNGWARA